MFLGDIKNPFSSSRLIYRAAEKDDEGWLALNNQEDPLGRVQNNPALWVPTSNKDGEGYREYITGKCLLGVIICLKPDAAADSKEDEKTGAISSNPPEKSKPIPVGSMSVTKGEGKYQHHRNSDIGLHIAQQYRNKGYGTEAIHWVLWWGFQHAGLHRIAIGCYSYNDGARRLYERLGFVFEQRCRENVWFNGGWHDTIGWALLEDEWREKVGLLKERK
ncbi:MAG: hypothetical protein MMC33_003396 [Icmadophila ericetorum]|nr:hypothetical protein [Icmadophila ericetorum]